MMPLLVDLPTSRTLNANQHQITIRLPPTLFFPPHDALARLRAKSGARLITALSASTVEKPVTYTASAHTANLDFEVFLATLHAPTLESDHKKSNTI